MYTRRDESWEVNGHTARYTSPDYHNA